jgi:hypothetical protein
LKNPFLIAFIVLPLVALPTAAYPATEARFSVESRTYLPAREDANSNLHLPIYEYLGLSVDDALAPGFYLRAAGWGRADLVDETYRKKSNGEFQYGYVGYRAPRLDADLRLGRFPVNAGVARNEGIDGIQAGSGLGLGFDLLAYAGRPVETSGGGVAADSIFGGRIAQGKPGLYRLGLSYLKEDFDVDAAREEAGADLWVRPLSRLSLSGSTLYNADAEDFARHDYTLLLGPFASFVQLTGRYEWVDYDKFFTHTRVTSFMTPALDPNERLQSAGGVIEFMLGAGVTLAGEYTGYAYDVMDSASAYGAKLSWKGAASSTGMGYRRSRSASEELRYAEYRGWFGTRMGKADMALSLRVGRYDEAVNGTRDALSLTLGGAYPVTGSIGLGANVEYAADPYYDAALRGMLNLTWRYSSTKGGDAK